MSMNVLPPKPYTPDRYESEVKFLNPEILMGKIEEQNQRINAQGEQILSLQNRLLHAEEAIKKLISGQGLNFC